MVFTTVAESSHACPLAFICGYLYVDRMRASELLEEFRRTRGMSLRQLARALKCSHVMVHHVCHGTKAPGLALAVAIERVTDGWWRGPIRPHMWVEESRSDAA